jgi:hypothetical protein
LRPEPGRALKIEDAEIPLAESAIDEAEPPRGFVVVGVLLQNLAE